jgi:hypothetical protein
VGSVWSRRTVRCERLGFSRVRHRARHTAPSLARRCDVGQPIQHTLIRREREWRRLVVMAAPFVRVSSRPARERRTESCVAQVCDSSRCLAAELTIAPDAALRSLSG